MSDVLERSFYWTVLESVLTLLYLFFFSSRRRHTRLTCDWSSDVCSSDLATSRRADDRRPGGGARGGPTGRRGTRADQAPRDGGAWDARHDRARRATRRVRSEERRVGKECRSRGVPEQ